MLEKIEDPVVRKFLQEQMKKIPEIQPQETQFQGITLEDGRVVKDPREILEAFMIQAKEDGAIERFLKSPHHLSRDRWNKYRPRDIEVTLGFGKYRDKSPIEIAMMHGISSAQAWRTIQRTPRRIWIHASVSLQERFPLESLMILKPGK